MGGSFVVRRLIQSNSFRPTVRLSILFTLIETSLQRPFNSVPGWLCREVHLYISFFVHRTFLVVLL